MRRYKSLNHGVPLEVIHKKCGVGFKLHLFLGAEFLELRVFGNAELEQSCENESGAVPKTPIVP
jgi:hypothetical protein